MPVSIELNEQPGMAVAETVDGCQKNALAIDWVTEANRYFSPVGLCPGRGGILLTESRIDQIDLTGSLELVLGDGSVGRKRLSNLRCVDNPRCINPAAKDPIYLVSLSDRRIDLMGATSRRYQWRFLPTDDAVATGTNGSDTLLEVLQDLWSLGDMGDFPGLPAEVPTPSAAVVDQLDLHAFRIADALEDIAGALGCGIVLNHTTDKFEFTYFPRATDNAVTVFRQRIGRLDADESPYVPKFGGLIPSTVCVLFPIWYPVDSDGKDPRRFYSVAVSRPTGQTWARGSVQVDRTVYLQDFTPCRIDLNDKILNETLLDARAAQVARIFFDRLTDQSPQFPIRRRYRGILNDPLIAPGGTFDIVGWEVGLGGPKTYVARSGLMATTELYTTTLEGIVTDFNLLPEKTSGGVVRRVGGIAPNFDRERASWGWSVGPTGLTISGAGLGPYFRRNSPLRQGDWASVGTGGRDDQRGRLWRNWIGEPVPKPTKTDCAPEGAGGWVGALKYTDCLTADIVSATGECATDTDVAWAAGFTYDDTVDAWVHPNGDELTIGGVEYTVRFKRVHDEDNPFKGDAELQLITDTTSGTFTYYGAFDCASPCVIIFGIGNSLCTPETNCPPERPNDRLIRIRFKCAVCAGDENPNWDGPGWYCIEGYTVVYYEFDPTNCVTILTGPYASLAEAEAACVEPTPPNCVTYGTYEIASIVFTNATGDAVCYPSALPGAGGSIGDTTAVCPENANPRPGWTTSSCPGNVQFALCCDVDNNLYLYGVGTTLTFIAWDPDTLTMVYDIDFGVTLGGSAGTIRATITLTP